MERVYIALGSNLNNPFMQITTAINELKNLPNTILINISSIYLSKPMGPINQPDYLNAVIALDTKLSPISLLHLINLIEKKHGRLRINNNNRWGPRNLDIDIILYGKKNIQTDILLIPHYDIKNRDFVLYPLIEIAPTISLPNGELLYNQLKLINKNNLKVCNYYCN